MYSEGKKFKPSASMFNELDKVARAYRNNANSAVGGTGQRAPATTIIWATNSTGGEVARGAPAWLSLSGSWQATAMTPEALAFTANAIPFSSFSSTPAVRTDPKNIQGIALDTGADGKMFPVALAGLAWAKVKLSITNGTAPCIGVLDASDSDKLTHHGRDVFGPHRIIATDSGTSSALVIVNGGFLDVAQGQLRSAIASGAYGDVYIPNDVAGAQVVKGFNQGSTEATAAAQVVLARDARDGKLEIISEYC